MIYKFKTPASGDVIMLGPQGDQMLRLIGRTPAAQGIIEVPALASARAALETASAAPPAAPAEPAEAARDERESVALRQRLWPMIELLRRAEQAQVPVVWGA